MRLRLASLVLLAALPGAGRAAPRIDVARLARTAPGWVPTGSRGDATTGSAQAEQVIWPMFYLHWRPLEGVGGKISIRRARRVVEQLWEGLVIDSPLEGRRVALPAHEGVVFETTTSHGEMRSRYFVWACPQSGRLLVADTNLSLLANAPDVLLDWQRDMARTVRCHAEAPVESFPHLPRRYEIPDADLSYAHPRTWLPLEAYRVQTSFGGTDMAAARHPGSTASRGQDLALAVDAVRRVWYSWGPAYDHPMNYDVLTQRVEDYWRERATNMILIDKRAVGDVWIADGIIRPRPQDVAPIPPTHLHKFRAWLWREEATTYFAVATVGGIRFGRRKLALPLEAWNRNLEEMFQALVP